MRNLHLSPIRLPAACCENTSPQDNQCFLYTMPEMDLPPPVVYNADASQRVQCYLKLTCKGDSSTLPESGLPAFIFHCRVMYMQCGLHQVAWPVLVIGRSVLCPGRWQVTVVYLVGGRGRGRGFVSHTGNIPNVLRLPVPSSMTREMVPCHMQSLVGVVQVVVSSPLLVKQRAVTHQLGSRDATAQHCKVV